jgi:hypothetical protein
MKHVKVFENFEYDSILEDILELKQMSRQMYSLLKSKGFEVKISNEEGKVRAEGITTRYDMSNEAQLIVQGKSEVVWVIIPVFAVVKLLMEDQLKDDTKLNQENWWYPASKKYGDSDAWIDNQEIMDYVEGLGKELLNELNSKYPGMEYKFTRDQSISYTMIFGYEETRKGGRKKKEKS